MSINIFNKLANLIIDTISPISEEINKLLKDEKFIDQILSDGAQKADKIASKKIKNIMIYIKFHLEKTGN